MSSTSNRHRNDIYGDLKGPDASETVPAIPAATVLLLKEGSNGADVLMLHKNSKMAFGGMWVFPGGKIDQADFPENGDTNKAAANAAVREAKEEADIDIDQNDFVWFAHWSPPPAGQAKRFATWFFAAPVLVDGPISVDGGEIRDFEWINPAAALEKHAVGDIDLAPPTWVSLYHLARYESIDRILEHFNSEEPRVYETRVVEQEGIRVAMWKEDAGYGVWDAGIEGPRHRLLMKPGGFVFEHSAVEY